MQQHRVGGLPGVGGRGAEVVGGDPEAYPD
jgi:hypothetical protein